MLTGILERITGLAPDTQHPTTVQFRPDRSPAEGLTRNPTGIVESCAVHS